jgi:hypothetical protein
MTNKLSSPELNDTGTLSDKPSRISKVLRRVFGITAEEERRARLRERLQAEERRRSEIDQILLDKYPDSTPAEREVLAYERGDLEKLCADLNGLPRSGANTHDLKSLGFRVHDRDTDYSIIRPVSFPLGWTMEPVTPEPERSHSGHATVLDETGSPRAFVVYRIEPSSGYPSRSSHTTIPQ